jgi:hypothetical protein
MKHALSLVATMLAVLVSIALANDEENLKRNAAGIRPRNTA